MLWKTLVLASLLLHDLGVAQEASGILLFQPDQTLTNGGLYVFSFKKPDNEFLWMLAPKWIDQSSVIDEEIARIQHDGFRGEVLKSEIPAVVKPDPSKDKYQRVMDLNIIAMNDLKKQFQQRVDFTNPLAQSLTAANQKPIVFPNLSAKARKLNISVSNVAPAPIPITAPQLTNSSYRNFKDLQAAQDARVSKDLERLSAALQASITSGNTVSYEAAVAQLFAYRERDPRQGEKIALILAKFHRDGFLKGSPLQPQLVALDFPLEAGDPYYFIGINQLLLEPNAISRDQKVLALMLFKAAGFSAVDTIPYEPQQVFDRLLKGWSVNDLLTEIARLGYFGNDTQTVKAAFEKIKSLT